MDQPDAMCMLVRVAELEIFTRADDPLAKPWATLSQAIRRVGERLGTRARCGLPL